MKFYIENSYCIGPFDHHDFKDFATQKATEGNVYKTIEPDYYECLKTHIVRRGSRSAKFGMYAALKCMENRNKDHIDGIIVSTSLGGLRNFEDFTLQMIDQEEVNLSPNPFIQSLHSTLSGNLALELETNVYNITYTNRGNAFETALLDARMNLMEGHSEILLGASDEISLNYQFSVLKDNFLNHKDSSEGCLGEGAAFFRLLKEKNQNSITVEEVVTFYGIDDEMFKKEISNLLDRNGILPENIDVIISGLKDNFSHDRLSKESTIYYKNFVGEYPTSISFALWLGENMIRENIIPDVFHKSSTKAIGNVLIINEYRKYKSIIILSK
ncbi:beta-ketoacyl synthase chain length factor [Flavobacterium chilense]|uniref:Beta-ketoacyl synthase, N-terminal domain n=1 Tax=Flavobacterium chilense TaxID=946677 RepID=A0A1M7MWU2_9FLAO|nr:beta-ketoacyl synthase chain length factor [Flavobacterium chilense]SHM95523.1 Beta-ketoacyl synthase, N-terminal domain [Flavobacterium chilense]